MISQFWSPESEMKVRAGLGSLPPPPASPSCGSPGILGLQPHLFVSFKDTCPSQLRSFT